jgi:hypothetical protein
MHQSIAMGKADMRKVAPQALYQGLSVRKSLNIIGAALYYIINLKDKFERYS